MNNSWIRYLPAFAYAELQKCVRGNKVKDVDNSRLYELVSFGVLEKFTQSVFCELLEIPGQVEYEQ